MTAAKLKIYNASAGSGKTFTLAKSYLRILLSSKNPLEFKHILALTFTNKAVDEMKERIISMLVNFSSFKPEGKPHPMLNQLCAELNMDVKDIKFKSSIILNHILHNYGAFEVSTIDAFMHRLIRTFAHELRIPSNFEVELDQERLLSEAVDSLLSKIGKDDLITSLLIDFAIAKSNEDKSWDISYDFNEVARLLLNEEDYREIQNFEDKDLTQFKDLKQTISKESATIEARLKIIAQKSLNLISKFEIDHTDFSRKALPNFFSQLLVEPSKSKFGAKWQDDLVNGNTLYPSRVSHEKALAIEGIQPELAKAFIKAKTYFYELEFLKSASNHLIPFSVLNLINNELNTIKKERNILLISEFNSLIQNEIREQPTPFIYERLGSRFKNFFIDEFQDTSKLQWQNLIPLLDNSLSGGVGDAMIVGDAKQAIYRWRGGEPEQFINLYTGEDSPFYVDREVLNLDTNYRSSKSIITFNNEFFEFLANNFFNNVNYQILYSSAGQKEQKDLDGFVKLKFLNPSKSQPREELYLEETLKSVNECLINGYNHSDICIITRKRKEGVLIADFLNENGIPVTSTETLLLQNSQKVKFLNSVLKLLLQPSNQKLRLEVMDYTTEQEDVVDKHNFFRRYLHKPIDDFLTELSPSDVPIKLDVLLQTSLYELVEHIISIFKLNKVSDAYLQFYLDEVFDFSQSYEPDLAGFIDYFERNEERLSIVVSDNIDAVKLTTIHKSKGLEFPVVIFPFADLNIYREIKPKIWFPVEEARYNGFNSLLLSFGPKVEHYRLPGEDIYNTHLSKLELDNVNLLYVALTRAVEQLYVISRMETSNSSDPKPRTFSGLISTFLKFKGLWLDSEDTYCFGNPIIKEIDSDNIATEEIELKTSLRIMNKLKVTTNAARFWNYNQEESIERGNLIHKILSDIKTVEDVDYALNLAVTSGELESSKKEQLRTLINNVVEHPRLTTFFDGTYAILNEQDILSPEGDNIRPDRMVFTNEKEIVIIDYKTGLKSNNHIDQLRYYSRVLIDMQFEVRNCILVYLNDTLEIVEV